MNVRRSEKDREENGERKLGMVVRVFETHSVNSSLSHATQVSQCALRTLHGMLKNFSFLDPGDDVGN